MSRNNVQNNNDTHIPSNNNPPNEQNIARYPAYMEAKIERRVNEIWECEREGTIQSSLYTHHSRDRTVSQSSEVPSAQNKSHERRPSTHGGTYNLKRRGYTETPKRTSRYEGND
ncbi:hypothetical protein LIER_17553 [Lithospermum erythrorhizon]|uniref:Uncharacterized protein n=1 Tax=Lithospermum erythrorhizon TaxID=34254 RepID=A0AAV3QE12_LITER